MGKLRALVNKAKALDIKNLAKAKALSGWPTSLCTMHARHVWHAHATLSGHKGLAGHANKACTRGVSVPPTNLSGLSSQRGAIDP